MTFCRLECHQVSKSFSVVGPGCDVMVTALRLRLVAAVLQRLDIMQAHVILGTNASIRPGLLGLTLILSHG